MERFDFCLVANVARLSDQSQRREATPIQFRSTIVPPQKSSKLIVSQVRAIPEHFDHFIGLALLRSIIS